MLPQGQMRENANTHAFMENSEAFGLKLVIRVVLKSTLRFLKTRGQSHCLTFDSGPLFYDISNISSKSTWPMVTKFHIDPPRVARRISPGHVIKMAAMTKMAAMPVKTSKIFFSGNNGPIALKFDV